MSDLYGSICLSDIPKSQMRKAATKSGDKIFLDIYIGKKKEPKTFGKRTYTHYVSCAPPKDKRVDGENYFIGDLTEREPKAEASSPATEKTNTITKDDLPF